MALGDSTSVTIRNYTCSYKLFSSQMTSQNIDFSSWITLYTTLQITAIAGNISDSCGLHYSRHTYTHTTNTHPPVFLCDSNSVKNIIHKSLKTSQVKYERHHLMYGWWYTTKHNFILSTDALSLEKEHVTRALGLTSFLNLISSKQPSVMKEGWV